MTTELATELATWRTLAETTDLGWPEWEVKDAARRARGKDALRWRTDGFWVACLRLGDSAFLGWLHSVTDHEAKCLFENHARQWAEGRGWKVTRWLPKDYVAALQASVRGADKEGKESQ